MPFASGVFTGATNSWNDAAAGDTIDPTDWNDTYTEFETAFNVLSKGTFAAKTDVSSVGGAPDIGGAATQVVRITGTTTITSLGTVANCHKYVYFADALILTHNGTSLILPGATNRTTVAGDCAEFISDGSGNWRCHTYLSSAGLVIPLAGVAAAGAFTASPRCVHTGGNPATAAADGTNLDIVVTELYVAEVFVPCNMTITGVAPFFGANTNGNTKVMLFNSAGTRVAISASTASAAFTADAYTNIAFSGTYAAIGPATYYVGIICDDNTNDLNTHVVGSFGAGKITGLVYATEAGYATITPPTTFTTGLGPIASLY